MTKIGSKKLVSDLRGSEEKLSFVSDSALYSSASSVQGTLTEAAFEEFRIIATLNHPAYDTLSKW